MSIGGELFIKGDNNNNSNINTIQAIFLFLLFSNICVFEQRPFRNVALQMYAVQKMKIKWMNLYESCFRYEWQHFKNVLIFFLKILLDRNSTIFNYAQILFGSSAPLFSRLCDWFNLWLETCFLSIGESHLEQNVDTSDFCNFFPLQDMKFRLVFLR